MKNMACLRLVLALCVGVTLCFPTYAVASPEGMGVYSLGQQGGVSVVVTDPEYGADGSDSLSDVSAINKALLYASDVGTPENPAVVTIPAGTYYIDKPLYIFSNTTLQLTPDTVMMNALPSTGATYQLIRGMHKDSSGGICPQDSNCTHGGYSQVENVVIRGGVWECGTDATIHSMPILITHGKNIGIYDLEILHATNHCINLSGTKDSIVSNVEFRDSLQYSGSSDSFWSGYEVGDKARYRSIEAVHLDFMNAAGERGMYPYDDTPCENVTVENCLFDKVFAGVGTHHINQDKRSKGVVVTNCTFSNFVDADPSSEEGGNAVNLYSGDGAVVHKCGFSNIKGNCIYTISCTGLEFSSNVANSARSLVVGSDASFTAKGNKLDSSAINGIHLTGGSDGCVIENNELTNIVGNGLYFSGVSNATVLNNTIGNTTLAGVRIVGQSTVTVDTNEIVSPGTHGVSVAGSNAVVKGNTVTSPPTFGIQISERASATISGNTISEAGQKGIYLNGAADGCTVSGNDVSGTSGRGIEIYNTLSANVGNNIVSDSTDHGIYVTAAPGSAASADIVGNTSTSSSSSGRDIRVGANVTIDPSLAIRDNVVGARGYTLDASSNAIFDLASNTPIVIDRVSDTYDFTGNAIKPAPWVFVGSTSAPRLAAGTDYVVTYRSVTGATVAEPKDPGLYEVVVTGVNSNGRGYTGSVSKRFEITAPPVKTYSITFDANGGSGTMGAIDDQPSGSKMTLTANAFERPGHTFDSWNTKKDGSGTKYANQAAFTVPDADTTLYAQWKIDSHTVTFNGNGATSGSTAKMTQDYGTKKALTANGFKRTGYSFAGWNTRADGKGASYADKASYTFNSDLVLYAQWKINTYKITFDFAGGSDPKNPSSYNVETPSFALMNPVRTGYTFVGWTGSNGTSAQASVRIDKGSTGNRNYKANWSINSHVVTFNGNGSASGSTAKMTQNYGSSMPLTANGFKRTGYSFAGWNTRADGKGASYADKASYTFNSDLVLYAQWDINSYTVTFNGNGATSGSTAKMTQDYGTKKALTANGFKRTGYSFAGWNTRADGKGASYADKATYTFNSGTTLYAQWKPVSYKITYKLNGGKAVGNPASYTVETATFTLKNPTRNGYTFLGWTGSNGKAAQTAVKVVKGSTGAKSYTANWAADITGVTLSPVSAAYTGAAIAKPKITVKAGSATVPASGYTATWSTSDFTKLGTKTLTVKGKGAYAGTTTATFRIVAADISKATVTIANQAHTGKALRPMPTVKLGGRTLKAGVDYSVGYKNNSAIGVATATITGKGGYVGAVSKTFRIVGWTRLWGQGSLDTMAAISKEYGTSKTAVVATNADFKDTLAAIGLAGSVDSPVLVTNQNVLSSQTRGELERMGVTNVYVVGGSGGVSTAVEKAIRSLPSRPSVKVIDGTDAPSKSVAAAKSMPSRSKTVIITRPLNFGDALSISPYAYATKSPVIYTDPATGGGTPQYRLSDEAVSYIRSAGFTHAVVVGGIYAVPESVLDQLASAGIASANVTRLAGNGAYETSRVIGEWATGKLKNGTGGGKGFYRWASIRFQPEVVLSANNVGISRGDDWKDALCGSALCGQKRSILLLASKENQNNAVVVKSNKDNVNHGYIFGGSVAVPEKVVKPFRGAAL